MALKGVLFDMDGVLVDSEAYINEAAIAFFKNKGVDVKPADFVPFIGAGEDRYIGGVAEKYGVPFNPEKDKKEVYSIFGELVKGILKPLPGTKSFIQYCKSSGLKIAVATSADRMKMLINLNEIGLSEDDFDATVCGEEVKNKKPDPEIFLKAAQKLRLDPKACLVIEDAINGVRAGKSGGFKVLALTSSFSASQLTEADWVTTNLQKVPMGAIEW